MSLFSSFIIDPVVRQARRFSGAAPPTAGPSGRPLSHANRSAFALASDAPPLDDDAVDDHVGEEHQAQDAQQTHGVAQHASSSSSSSSSPPPLPAEFASELRAGNDGTMQDASVSLTRRATAPRAPVDTMLSDSSSTIAAQLRQFHVDAPLDPSSSAAAVVSTNPPPDADNPQPSTDDQHATTVSEPLPADDGMGYLRARMHQIRDLAIADEEKARMMHGLMTEQYNFLRPTSPSSFVSQDRPFTPTSAQSVFSDTHLSSPASVPSEIDPENPFNLRPGDTEPTYRPPPAQALDPDLALEDDEFEAFEEEASLGCQHYKRNVKVQCFACRRWYTCRHCHDAVEDHNLNRAKTENMLCMGCGTPQKAGEYCVHCGMQAACYYCEVCKLWDNNSNKKIYHCVDCGICRRGAGLGRDYVHCKNCNVCISIAHASTHKCIERATDCDCPICGEYLFNSSTAVVSMPCGHYLHKGCYNEYMETAYKCPTCKKSAVNMELQWQKLTQAIESQPMPEQFADTRAVVQCNDCSAKSSVKYHWLGNKCSTCDSYNTNELRILNGPESEQTANAILQAETDAYSGARSPASVSSPASQPLRSPRYYFQPDEPEQTWLPSQLPSFPFQMPQMPQMPQFPGMPQFPQFSGMPQLPPFPQMPQMPDPYELLQRVQRSFDHYLNPTGEIPNEDVPIIDLDVDDEHREMRATDGTTVRLPSLPQYVLDRFNQSLTPLRNYLNSPTEQIPALDLSEDHDDMHMWGEGGGRVGRFFAGEDDEDDDEEETSSEESVQEEEDDEDDEDAEEDENELQLPGHR